MCLHDCLPEAVSRPATAQSAHACSHRCKEDRESKLRAVQMYKDLQQCVQESDGFDNDQNAIVLRLLADTLEAVGQYGMPSICITAYLVWICILFVIRHTSLITFVVPLPA